MADERNFGDGKRAKNLREWEVEIREEYNEILSIVRNSLGNCSNKNVCAEDIFEMALVNISNKSIDEVDIPKAYFITTAKHLVPRYSKNCSACSKNSISLNNDFTEEISDEMVNRGIRRNGRALSRAPNEASAIQKDTEEREERIRQYKILKNALSELTPKEQAFIVVLHISEETYEKKMPRIREIYPNIKIDNVRRKICYLRKKLKKIITKRGKNE